jgi:hypothetical protein
MSSLSVAIAVISMASVFESFLLVRLSRWERGIALLSSISFLIYIIPMNRIIGLVLFLTVIINQIRKRRAIGSTGSGDL